MVSISPGLGKWPPGSDHPILEGEVSSGMRSLISLLILLAGGIASAQQLQVDSVVVDLGLEQRQYRGS